MDCWNRVERLLFAICPLKGELLLRFTPIMLINMHFPLFLEPSKVLVSSHADFSGESSPIPFPSVIFGYPAMLREIESVACTELCRPGLSLHLVPYKPYND